MNETLIVGAIWWIIVAIIILNPSLESLLTNPFDVLFFWVVAELCTVFSTHEYQRPVPKNGTVEDDIPFQSGHFSGFPCHAFWQVFKNGCPYSTSTWLIQDRV